MIDSYFPQVVRLDATWRCNLNCKHCQTAMFREDDHPDDLSDQRLTELFEELGSLGTHRVNFLGGEPLLRTSLLEHIEHLRRLGIYSDVTTNGLLIDAENAGELIRNDVVVGVSLDGATDETHRFIRGKTTFQKALNGVNLLVEERNLQGKGIVGLTCVLNRRNVHEVEDLVDLACELDLDYLIVAAVQKVGNALTFWDDLSLDSTALYNAAVRLARRISTKATSVKVRVNFFLPRFREHILQKYGLVIPQQTLFDRSSLYECYIQCDGRVFPSQKYSEMNEDILQIGSDAGILLDDNSLLNHSLADVWRSDAFNTYRELMTSLTFMKEYTPCQSCNFSKTYCIPSPGAFIRGEASPQLICSHIHNEASVLEVV